MDRRRLGEILVDEAIVSAETVHRALAMQPGTPRRRLGQLLVESGALDPGWLTAALAQQAGCETLDPLALPVDPARLWLVPPDVAERLGAFVACDADGPIAVLADPTARLFPAERVVAIDTTGAGDVFTGVLAAAWAMGKAVPDAIAAAQRAAAISVGREGCFGSFPTKEEIKRVLF